MKGPDRSHFIQRFKFDFEIERREDANHLQNTLSRLFSDRIKQMLDRLMTKYDDPAFVTRIPTLELDLGILQEDRYEDELMMRLELQFERELSLRMAELKHATAIVSADKGERTAIIPAQIEVITHFLVQGRLPMGAESMAGKIEQLFWELLDEQPRNMISMLKNVVGRNQKAMRRLANSFSDKLIERVYALAIDQNSLSIISYEKQLASQVAKAASKPLAIVEAELRVILLSYLIVERPPSFQLAVMQEVVAERIGKIYGKPAQEAVQQKERKTATEDPKGKKEALEKGRMREAAVQLLTDVIQGKAAQESNLAIIEAWEFLVANDLAALKQVLAGQASHPEALVPLVEAIPSVALRNFVQRISTNIGLRLIQIAATVVSAHELFAPTAATHARITQAIYAALLHEVAVHPTASPKPETLLKAIQTYLTAMPAPAAELIAHWEDFDFTGSEALQKPDPKTEVTDTEPQTPEQKAESQRRAQEAIRKLAEEEQNRPPLTPEERRAAAEKAREEQERAKLRAESWEEEQLANIERARRTEAGEDDEMADTEFFKRGRERLRQVGQTQRMEPIEDLSRIIEGGDQFAMPLLESVEARADVVMHFLATGAAPWWAKRFVPMQVEMMVKNLIQRDPEALREAFERTARSLPSDRHPLFVKRILEHLSENTFVAFVPLVAGELSGFVVSMALALEASVQSLPEGIAAPSTERQKRAFAYEHQLRYFMAYAGSSTSPAQMLRFVLKQKQVVMGTSSRQTIEWMADVLEDLIAKGERRFNPLKTMLPKVFEGIEVAAPLPPTRDLDTIAFERTLQDRQPKTETELTLEAKEAKEAQEAQEAQEKKEAEEALAAQVGAGADPVRGVEMEVPFDVQSPRIEDGNSPPISGPDGELTDVNAPESLTKDTGTSTPEQPEAKKNADPIEGENEKPIKGENQKPTEGENEKRIEGENEKPIVPSQELAPEDEDEESLTPQQKAQREQARKWHERMKAAFYPDKVEEPEAEPEVMELTPEEVETFGVSEEWVIATIRYYLVHGSLSPAATAMYSAATFREEIKTAFASGTRAVIQMVREIIGNRDVRQRLYGMDDELVLMAIKLVNAAAADRLLPYVREVATLFGGTSSPITRTYVYEHAILHALSLRTTFLPINYMKEFFEFIAMQPAVNVKEAIIWANRRLETSSSPLKASLDEMLDVVDRIQQLRETRKQQSPEDGRRSAPTYIPSAMDDEIYVSNAGAGILYLFIIQIFKAFKMVTDDKKEFVSNQAKVRGIHQIQYLCYKELDSPEEKMVLAKLIVGWPLDEPLEPLETPLNEDDTDTCDAIMGMVCEQWGVMKNAGGDYVRKTFIEREGRLKQEGSDWMLRVEQNGIDVLKNKIPWSTNPIRMPWLDYVIEVEWP